MRRFDRRSAHGRHQQLLGGEFRGAGEVPGTSRFNFHTNPSLAITDTNFSTGAEMLNFVAMPFRNFASCSSFLIAPTMSSTNF